MSVKSHFFINFAFWARFFFFSNLQEKSRLQGRSELASRSISKIASSELISTYIFWKGRKKNKGEPKVVRKLMPTPTVGKLRQMSATNWRKVSLITIHKRIPYVVSVHIPHQGGRKVQILSGDNISNIGKFECDKLAESFLDYNTQAHTLCCSCTSSGVPEGLKT